MALLLPAAAGAQLAFGVKAGLTFADLSDVDADSRTGWAAGVALRLAPSALLSIQPGVMYVAKGAEDIELGNIDVPVLLKFDLPLEALNLFATAGPYASFNVSCDIPAVSPGVDPRDDIEETDFGGVQGGGVRLGSVRGVRGLNFEAPYQFGVTDISPEGVDVDPKNKPWFLLAGLDF
ncbi:MAG: porin family protein [Gemmatimonadales bacterium]